MRIVQITTRDNQQYELLEDPPPDLIHVYRTLHLKWPRRFYQHT
jgi:hypothetical protein